MSTEVALIRHQQDAKLPTGLGLKHKFISCRITESSLVLRPPLRNYFRATAEEGWIEVLIETQGTYFCEMSTCSY